MMKRRQLLNTGVLLLLLGGGGAIVNVAVAWGLTFTTDIEFEDFARSEDDVYAYVSRGKGAMLVTNCVMWTHNPPPSALPQWAAQPFRDDPELFGFVEGSGWPLICLRAKRLFLDDQGEQVIDSGIEIALYPFNGSGVMLNRVLPLHPLWPGFAINTIFYAAMLWGGWVVFFVPGMVRRRIRRKRGLCPACAYPIGTSPVCTECGTAVTPR